MVYSGAIIYYYICYRTTFGATRQMHTSTVVGTGKTGWFTFMP